MKKNKLSHFEAVCFVLICMINEIILNVSQNYVLSVGTGAIINLILVRKYMLNNYIYNSIFY